MPFDMPSIIIGVAIGIFIFTVFMPPRKRGSFLDSPSLLTLHDYFNFKKMLTIWFARLLYVILACVLTVYAIIFMLELSLWAGLGMLILGNILLRIMLELFVVLFSIHKNLNIITDKITGRLPEEFDDVSVGEFFGDMSTQIKRKQAKARAERQQQAQRELSGQQTAKSPARHDTTPPAQGNKAPPAQHGQANAQSGQSDLHSPSSRPDFDQDQHEGKDGKKDKNKL